jgi:hypothetical protein
MNPDAMTMAQPIPVETSCCNEVSPPESILPPKTVIAIQIARAPSASPSRLSILSCPRMYW